MLIRSSLTLRRCLAYKAVTKPPSSICQNCQTFSGPGEVISYQFSRQLSSGQHEPKGDIGRRKKIPRIEEKSEDLESCNDDKIFDREYIDMQIEDFSELYKGDESIKEKISVILNEYEHLKYDSIGRVPSVISLDNMKMMLEEGNTPHARARLIHFLFKREMHRRQSERKKQREKEELALKRQDREKELGSRSARSGLLTDDGELMYGLWHNSLFSRIPENKMKYGLSASRLNTAAQFGRKIIFDFGFEQYMNKFAIRNSAEQLQEAYGMNRFDYLEPLDFWFCNFDKDSFLGKYCIEHTLRNLYTKSMITVKDDCMTNHFDKSRLVYLSPNAKEPLGQILKSDDIYIIGVYNDKGNVLPVSSRKANKLGIRSKCLPIDAHLPWQGSSKALCINHVVGVLLEVLSNGGDWHAAMVKHIPSRKIKPMELVVEEERRRMQRMQIQNQKKKKASFSLRYDFD